MAIPNDYYLNGSSLSDATAVFTDNELTVLAADGWYSNGEISRQQLYGVLLPQQNCPTCGTSCGGVINASGTQGVYLINVDLGTDSVGAVIIKFNPYYVPDGIRVIYNGVVYNKLSAPLDGLHSASNSEEFTYVGDAASDCGISGITYPALQEYLFDGGSFISTGNTQSITVLPDDVSLSSAFPGDCIIVIPKLTETPNIANIEIVGPCEGTSWSISVACPVLLTSFPASNMGETELEACSFNLSTFLYLVKVSSGTTVDVHDYVFLDQYGYQQAPEGYYKINDNNIIHVVNGIVTELLTCDITPTVCNNYKVTNNTPNPLYISSVSCNGTPLQDSLIPANGGVFYSSCLSSISDPSGLLNIEIYTPNCGAL